MRILVTGGAGFIGSHLAHRLLREGNEVDVLDNLSTGVKENIPAQANFLNIDLSQTDFVKKLPAQKYDAVCHLAAQSSGKISSEMPLYDAQANALSTLLLSRWCLESSIPRFLLASSMLVYGQGPLNQAATSEDRNCLPVSYYGVSKLASEHFLRVIESTRFRSTSFRMFNVYGPGQNMSNLKQGMVSIYLAYLLRGDKLVLTGTLDRFRDFVYIDDVIEAWVTALLRPSTPSLTYNIGSGRPHTVKELLDLLIKTCGLDPAYPVEENPTSSMEQFGLYADIARAQAELGWAPKTDIETGIQEMVLWAKSWSA